MAKILIVEDESMEQLILRIILERAGHELFLRRMGKKRSPSIRGKGSRS